MCCGDLLCECGGPAYHASVHVSLNSRKCKQQAVSQDAPSRQVGE